MRLRAQLAARRVASSAPVHSVDQGSPWPPPYKGPCRGPQGKGCHTMTSQNPQDSLGTVKLTSHQGGIQGASAIRMTGGKHREES